MSATRLSVWPLLPRSAPAVRLVGVEGRRRRLPSEWLRGIVEILDASLDSARPVALEVRQLPRGVWLDDFNPADDDDMPRSGTRGFAAFFV
mmetsp:Transcript_3352/g.7913  ORF Transcript_3352/g.7913 Transcript_3352/m.7913 type:complete len:91 (-) Transcript_3352:214-486(-)